MLAIAAFYDYEIWKMDVKTAFLNGYLKEELYMMLLGIVAEFKIFLRITKIHLWSILATRGKECIYIPL